MTTPRNEGCIQLVGTPIGNLGDITFRAVQCLKAADVIACEDTRHSRKLLSHLDIADKELVALHDHNEDRRSSALIERAQSGETVVFLSDAGMPTISDPGYRLVNASVEAGVRIEVIPGPCAVVTGLAGSGLPTDAFYFGGFLPVKSGKKTREIEDALSRKESSVFFESPHRIVKTLGLIKELDPERKVCVARELTKKFETFHRGIPQELLEEFGDRQVKGEITLIIQGRGRKSARPSKEQK